MQLTVRKVITSIILTFVTCGIYGIYWTYCLVKEAVAVKDSADKGVLEILLSIFIAPIGFYFTERKFAEGCAAQGVEHKDNAVIYLVLCLIPCGLVITMAMMQNEFNKIREIIG